MSTRVYTNYIFTVSDAAVYFVLDQSRQYENNSCSALLYHNISTPTLQSIQSKAQLVFIMRWRGGCLILILSLVIVIQVSSEDQDLSNGWGSDYAWLDNLEAAQNKANLQWK